MVSRLRLGFLALCLVGTVVPGVVGSARAATPSCAPPPTGATPMVVVVGVVACQELTTHALGDGVAAPFEYYVPPRCMVAGPCPVLYLLHGFGGDFTEMLGQPGTTDSAWVQALDHAPPAGFGSSPWTYADPHTWQPAPPLDVILVAPRGQTLPGGYGPGPGQDSYWTDWNPRYAAGGDQVRYITPPPQFDRYLTEELPDFITAHLPTVARRDFRAIAGVSLGGFGAFKEGLQHPDFWSSMISVSGAHNFLFAPAPQPLAITSPIGVQPPMPIAYTRLPALTGALAKVPTPAQVGTFLTALDALGDPVADQAYFRGNMPPDLAMNARTTAPFGIDSFVNDMVARRPQDLSSTPFEVLVFPMNVDMQAAFLTQGVPDTFAIHQGNHSDVYRNAWFRGLEEYANARFRNPLPAPPTFDYRTIATHFSIWGWQFDGTRAPVEFLTMRNVSCHGLTVQGTGTWHVTPPPACGHGAVDVDLGPASATDDPAALGATPIYGRTTTVALG